MIASLLSPSSSTSTNPPGPGRISQLLPSVKCSTCHQPVPLAELGDHTCTAPPPVPSLPKPAFTPEAATALLPDRLQGRVANEPPSRGAPQISSSSSNSRLRINPNAKGPPSPTQPSYQPRSSPLARADSSQSLRNDSRSSPQTRDPPYPMTSSSTSSSFSSNAAHSYSNSYASSSSSPLRTRPPGVEGSRMRTPSNAGSTSSNQSTPATARPANSFLDSAATTPVQSGRPNPPNNTPRGPPAIGIPFPTSSPYPNRTGSAPPLNINNPNYRAGPQVSAGAGGRTGGPPGPPMARPPPPSHSISEPSFNNPINNNNNNPMYRQQEFVPAAERGIDTKTGGAAGMAGVGRRGFAAAARAAMFVNPPLQPGDRSRPMGPQMQGQGPGPGQAYNQYNRSPFPPPNMAPRLLDTDALSRSTTETPPLSAGSGSGYSSHSPGPPTSPISNYGGSSSVTLNRNASNSNQKLPLPPPTSPLPPPPLNRTATSASSASFSSASILSRAQSAASAASKREKSVERQPVSPIDSESEYGGLAYADSTDDEEDDEDRKRMMSRSRSRSGSRSRLRDDSPPPPMTATATKSAAAVELPEILRKISTSSSVKSGHGMQFGSVSVRSRSNDRGSSSKSSLASGSVAGSFKRSRSQAPGTGMHSRDTSASSAYSSIDGGGDGEAGGEGGLKDRVRARTDSSAAIAQALGLSQTPPSEYARLGGPGVGGRSRSLKRDGVLGSVSGSLRRDAGVRRDEYEKEKTDKERRRDGSITSGADFAMQRERERERKLTLENERAEEEERRGRAGAARVIRNINVDTRAANEGLGYGGGGAKTQRSNTVQGIQSPDAAQKPIKLPTRSLTSPQLDRDKALGSAAGVAAASASSMAGSRAGSDVNGARKTARRPKTCLRCSKTIENGRWISVDSGGVLCESCWKNMYLPKCRRCSKPIERQAVSSSDGQLKGKYHKECFNCHICHKPFPDQSFYVYDGRPLCAYHYHEANDSLCAAARCGQPIEGPCAVSHSGDRYHPEHMTCEHPGREPCRERLEEYWEVDGRMLCERHAAAAGRSGGGGSGSGSGSEGGGRGEREEWERRRDLRAMKRVTRFIDLAGGEGLGLGVAAGAGSREDDSGLR